MTSLAYRFDTAAGGIVFAGDCADCAELRAIAKGAATLVVACTHFGSSATNQAIADVITGTLEVVLILGHSGVRRVVLTHLNSHFANPEVKERVLAEITRSYTGAILCPDELTSLDLAE
ncbi:MAG: hypothetical protein HYV35_05750 [Lentisphaerae bacterium]|nr:hypothetical protein [Lentisphaerota bacterium]